MKGAIAIGCMLGFQGVGAEPDALEPLVIEGEVWGLPAGFTSPSPVDHVSAETARLLGIDVPRKALQLIPNTSITEGDSPRASSFSVRGSREITFHEFTGGATGVGYYLDGIPVMDAYGRDLALFDLERITFFKGPHGTAMGVPHSMGVMDVVTRAPDSEARGNLAYRFGSYDTHRLTGHWSGPLAKDLYLGIDGMYASSGGWFRDRLTGGSFGKRETLSGRMRLRWMPTERLEINLMLSASSHDDDPQVYVASDRTRDRYRAYTSPDAYATGGQRYQALQLKWDADDWGLTSTTVHRASHFEDYDPVFLRNIFDPGILPRYRRMDVTNWTQEFRVESTDPDARWRWRAGVFLSTSESKLDHHMLGLGPWEGGNRMSYQREHYALYGEVTRVVNECLELSAGIRIETLHAHTRSSFEPMPFAESIGGAALSLDRKKDFNAVLPMVAATWKWSDTQRSYLRISAGMQPGGLAIAAAGSGDYDSERSVHYALGHEASFLDGALKTRLSAFYTSYRDYQSFQFNPAGQTVFNAERAHAYGLEAKVRATPCDGLDVYLSAGYTRARFDDFVTPAGDFSGKRINNIPVGTVSAGAQYRASWGGVARLDWRWVGDTFFDEGNTVKQDAYSLLSARIGYERGDFGIYLYGSNLLDTEYYTHTYLFQGLPAATPGSRRVVGLECRLAF